MMAIVRLWYEDGNQERHKRLLFTPREGSENLLQAGLDWCWEKNPDGVRILRASPIEEIERISFLKRYWFAPSSVFCLHLSGHSSMQAQITLGKVGLIYFLEGFSLVCSQCYFGVRDSQLGELNLAEWLLQERKKEGIPNSYLYHQFVNSYSLLGYSFWLCLSRSRIPTKA